MVAEARDMRRPHVGRIRCGCTVMPAQAGQVVRRPELGAGPAPLKDDGGRKKGPDRGEDCRPWRLERQDRRDVGKGEPLAKLTSDVGTEVW